MNVISQTKVGRVNLSKKCYCDHKFGRSQFPKQFISCVSKKAKLSFLYKTDYLNASKRGGKKNKKMKRGEEKKTRGWGNKEEEGEEGGRNRGEKEGEWKIGRGRGRGI